MRKLLHFIKAKSRITIKALLSGLIVLIVSYEMSNLPLFTGENMTTFSVLQWVKEFFTSYSVDSDLDDAVFINTSHDKMLTDFYEGKRCIGNTDISDRWKLYSLLTKLDSLSYKYILFDIRFEDGISTDADSLLFHQISAMNNIVIASHKNINIADSVLSEKSAIADFYSTIVSTNFAHYHYLPSGKLSMPAFAYKELTNDSIVEHIGFSISNGQLCQKSLFLQFGTEKFSYLKENGDLRYYNIGSDILDNTYLDLPNTIKNKVVIIGNFEEDTHDTYAGKKPGSLIVYRALSSLLNGVHLVPFWYLFAQFVLYSLISLTLFTRKSLFDRMPYFRNNQHRLIRFAVSFLGYSSVLFIVSVFLFLMFDRVLSVLWISLFFSCVKYILSLIERLK